MTIQKGDRRFTVRECKKSWSVLREIGGVSVTYNVSKELCKSEAELLEYVKNSDIF